jgi:alkylated DNA repair protein (DNA oxidative demethylase)
MPVTLDLFPLPAIVRPEREPLAEGAVVLRGFVGEADDEILAAVAAIEERAPFRQMKTPGGRSMSAEMTNAGSLGWVSDERGYRYTAMDPTSSMAWPEMPPVLRRLATRAAAAAGFPSFDPDACLVNRYVEGARMGLHQDKDERDFGAPIVSVSLGLPIAFLFGGLTRAERPVRIALEHRDVVVFGGPARLRFHGVAPLGPGQHPRTGATRINLTFRKAS